ncbi:MAG TPA: metallophosphoesterase [Clostridia bacterium]|nr:metallophosphoesterase [Clostridia bacterium]
MPAYLAPLSRRRFLARWFVASAVLALNPRLLAAPKPVNEDSWALLSDTHVAADAKLVSRGINMSEHFAAVARELLRLPKRPAGVLLSGDNAYNTGETGDYARLAGLLKPIREGEMPVHVALGNHDHRERFWEAFQEQGAAKRPVNDHHVALLRGKTVNWFILDSLETTNVSPGMLGPEQLTWLEKTLDENPDRPAFVLIHHNPGVNGGNVGLKDTFPLLGIIRPRKQVKAYIYGHTHSWKVESDVSGIHFINLPPVSYVFREGEPTGWVHLTVGESGMQLELRCHDESHPAHGQIKKLDWRA